MKRFLFIFASLLSVFAVLMPAPLSAQEGNVEALTRESVRYINALPVKVREAFLAEMYQLLFLENKGNPYRNTFWADIPIIRKGVQKGKVGVPHVWVEGGARFVGSDGRLYDFYEAGPHFLNNSERLRTLWDQGKRTLHFAGKQNVRPLVDEQLRTLELKRAEYLLKKMPPLCRQALFAELLKLCCMPDGSPGCHAEESDWEFCGETFPVRAPREGCLFMGADGKLHSLYEVFHAQGEAGCYYWECIKLAWLHKQKKMLLPYKEEISMMRKHYAVVKKSAPQASSAADAVDESAPSPQDSSMGRSVPDGSTLMGSTVPPDAGERPLPEAADVEANAQEAVRLINRLPLRSREAFLAELGGLLYLENGESVFAGEGADMVELKHRGVVVETVRVPYRTINPAAHYVGGNGREYAFIPSQPGMGSSPNPQAVETWYRAKLFMHRSGSKRVAELCREDIRRLENARAACFLRKMPPAFREALFAELLEVGYMPDGSPGFRCGIRWEYNGQSFSNGCHMRRGCMFRDAAGNEHDFYAVLGQYWKDWRVCWDCLKMCYLSGNTAPFAPYEESMEAIRGHYDTRAGGR